MAQPRLFGGFAFREAYAPDVIWTGFHPAHFILPHFQLVTQGDQSWLTINALLPSDEKASANLPMLQEALDIRVESLQKAAVLTDEKSKGHKSPCCGRGE